ncbi:MAG: hypothetical protein CMF46_04440 [Legionellales bacterium]|nr:hypothetical protein [Legionellales bacterium]|tara:strand:- start:980 stop:1381 length:402 start_codon:yes stop_codon:yes gene_type:complete
MAKAMNEKILKSEYMSSEQLEYFKNRLNNDLAIALKELDRVRAELADTRPCSDICDIAANEEIRNINLRSIDRLTVMIHKIEKALDNIQKREYGYCTITGEEIGIPRLLVTPTAEMSKAAKEMEEYTNEEKHR